MKNGRIDIASIRRGQIIDAAIAVIAEQGLPHLSLSEIETRAAMSRGQLTYYYKTKEDILLAVWDRVLQLMCQRMMENPGSPVPGQASCLEIVQHLLTKLLLQPPVSPEFHTLQYTFLAQIGYREDFRQRLAILYEEWRGFMANDLEADHAQGRIERRVSPRAMATVVQALLHGLTMQAAADPQAFDRQEVVHLCLDLLGNYLGVKHDPAPTRKAAPSTKQAAKTKRPRSPAVPATVKE